MSCDEAVFDAMAAQRRDAVSLNSMMSALATNEERARYVEEHAAAAVIATDAASLILVFIILATSLFSSFATLRS